MAKRLTRGVLIALICIFALYALAGWLLFYGGFVLRSGADRLVVTVYPQSAPAVFTLSMGFCCLIAALGSEQDPKAVMKLLRQVQKYVVSIYDGAKRQLEQEDAIHTLYCGHEQSCSVQVLDKRFYHADYGITLEGGEHEVLLL